MFKSFDKSRVKGPAISVRLNNGSGSFARPSYARNGKIPARRGSRTSQSWLGRVKSLLTPAGDMKQYAVYGMFAILGVLLVSHILLINGAAAKGYEMRKVQNAIAEQTQTEQDLELKTAEQSSLSSVDESAAMNRLVTVSNQEFLAPATVTAYQTAK